MNHFPEAVNFETNEELTSALIKHLVQKINTQVRAVLLSGGFNPEIIERKIQDGVEDAEVTSASEWLAEVFGPTDPYRVTITRYEDRLVATSGRETDVGIHRCTAFFGRVRTRTCRECELVVRTPSPQGNLGTQGNL